MQLPKAIYIHENDNSIEQNEWLPYSRLQPNDILYITTFI
jgi:hypothetical protein